jgi:phosphohistidine phosphatase
MDLYLIRHADAVPRGTPGYSEDARPLTEPGHLQARRLGEMFRSRGIRFDSVVTSPLVRAFQTTEGLLAGWPEPRPGVLTLDELAEEVRPRRVLKFVEKLGQQTIALVGHQPSLGEFGAWLIGSKKCRLELDKAGFAWIACDALEKGGGLLRLLITPEWI